MFEIKRIEKAQKYIEKEKNLVSIQDNANELQREYIKGLETDPKYSLLVDPENKYHMSKEEKTFIKMYVEYKSIPAAAEFAGINMDTAKSYYLSYDAQQEIRRINMAMYQRQFATRLLDLDEIAGYLSSLLLDMNVPSADQLKTTDKLRVVQMLIDLNKLKIESFNDPSKLMEKDLDSQIKQLSITTIQKLLSSTEDMKKKNDIIYDVTGTEVLSPEETAYLSTLPTETLLDLIQKTEEKESKNDDK